VDFSKSLENSQSMGGNASKSLIPALVFRNCGGQIQVGAVEWCGRMAQAIGRCHKAISKLNLTSIHQPPLANFRHPSRFDFLLDTIWPPQHPFLQHRVQTAWWKLSPRGITRQPRSRVSSTALKTLPAFKRTRAQCHYRHETVVNDL